MTCERCGKILEPGERFCPACGKAVELPQPAAPAAPVFAPVPDEPSGVMRAETTGESLGAQYKAPPQQASTSAQYKAPSPQPAAPVKEKEYFGKGALALCLIVIGLLAASTGVFACLYFSLVGMI